MRKREREGGRYRERDSSTGTQQSGDMAAAWLPVIIDELRSSCVPSGARFDSPLSPLCCALQACSQTSGYTCKHTRSPHMYYTPPKQPCLFHFIDRLSALSCPLISCSALCLLYAPGCCFVLFINPACLFLQASSLPCTPPSPSHPWSPG